MWQRTRPQVTSGDTPARSSSEALCVPLSGEYGLSDEGMQDTERIQVGA